MRHEFEKEYEIFARWDRFGFKRKSNGNYISNTIEDAWKEYQEKHKKDDKVSEFLREDK